MYNCIVIVRFLSMNDAGKMLRVAFYSGVKYLHRVFWTSHVRTWYKSLNQSMLSDPLFKFKSNITIWVGGGEPLRWYFYLYPDM